MVEDGTLATQNSSKPALSFLFFFLSPRRTSANNPIPSQEYVDTTRSSPSASAAATIVRATPTSAIKCSSLMAFAFPVGSVSTSSLPLATRLHRFQSLSAWRTECTVSMQHVRNTKGSARETRFALMDAAASAEEASREHAKSAIGWRTCNSLSVPSRAGYGASNAAHCLNVPKGPAPAVSSVVITNAWCSSSTSETSTEKAVAMSAALVTTYTRSLVSTLELPVKVFCASHRSRRESTSVIVTLAGSAFMPAKYTSSPPLVLGFTLGVGGVMTVGGTQFKSSFSRLALSTSSTEYCAGLSSLLSWLIILQQQTRVQKKRWVDMFNIYFERLKKGGV
mmetsp:Transcript_21188/g.43407  ORF Transcript_21188/g.43407 Transcript_21188/m.43407 type:complete len:337 (+) Transcript_21188:608-1618(+)